MATKYKQQPDGSYSTLVWDGTYDAKGNKHRRQIRSTKSSADLERKVAAFKQEVAEHTAAPTSDIDFVVYAWKWFYLYKNTARQNTKAMYENVIEKHFEPLKGISMSKITSYHLLTVMADVSPSLANKIYLTFKQIIKRAIQDRILPQIALEDIFDGISIPKAKPKEKRALYEEEKRAILNTRLEGLDKTYLWLAYGCGLRREEILALTYEDISDVVKINKVVTFNKNDPVIEYTTKSHNGVRTVPLPDFLIEYTKKEFKGKKGQIFVFNGDKLYTNSVYRRMWDRIVADIDFSVMKYTGLTSHYLRHNYCTMLLRQVPTISIKDVAYLMGDSEQVIINVYNHLIDNSKEQVKAINKALNLSALT